MGIFQGGNPPHVPGRLAPASVILNHAVSVLHLVAQCVPHWR